MIKKYKIFLESIDQKMISYNSDRYLKTISLYHCGDHIYVVEVEDNHSRAMIFLRPQEYYESAFKEIINKQFKFSVFQNKYKQHYGKQEFTYGSDWSGFNIPSDVLEECMFNIDKDEMNNYDKILISIINTINTIEEGHKYYLLGVDNLNSDVIDHEIAHALYFTIPEYKKTMNNLNDRCDISLKDSIYKCITEYGYADHVLPDEMQAYMSTGIADNMENIPNIDDESIKYKEVFTKFYEENLYSNTMQMRILWD